MALLNCILTAVKIVLMTINDCIGGPLSACDCLGAESLVVTINPEFRDQLMLKDILIKLKSPLIYNKTSELSVYIE